MIYHIFLSKTGPDDDVEREKKGETEIIGMDGPILRREFVKSIHSFDSSIEFVHSKVTVRIRDCEDTK